jgi:hypothetical protein
MDNFAMSSPKMIAIIPIEPAIMAIRIVYDFTANIRIF